MAAAIDRRGFLRVSFAAAGGLFVSLYLDPIAKRALAREGAQQPAPARVYPPDAFVNIRPDGKIVIQVNRLEFGQGVQTSLPMVLADELEPAQTSALSPSKRTVDVYKDPMFGIQMVGGSGFDRTLVSAVPRTRREGVPAFSRDGDEHCSCLHSFKLSIKWRSPNSRTETRAGRRRCFDREQRPKIHRATLAVDCGLAVNPLSVESQFQTGVTFGLSQLMAKGATS